MEHDTDFLREGVRLLAQELTQVEVSQHVGAGCYGRTPTRTWQRNGSYGRQLDTRVGSVDLAVPRVPDGSFFPTLREPRKRAKRALVVEVQEAYIQGVSTRRVDHPVKSLGMSGISKCRASGLCEERAGTKPAERLSRA